MFELDVVGTRGYCFPVWRHAGAQEWNYFQVDGQYVALPGAKAASSFLDEVWRGAGGAECRLSALGS
jgi:hypothetical protein